MHMKVFAYLCQICNNLRTTLYEKAHFMVHMGGVRCLPSSTWAIISGNPLPDKGFCKVQNRRVGDTEEGRGRDIAYL